jgi:hypothetical protein
MKKLSVFFAEGKISEESYLRSIRRLERKIKDLKELKKNPETFDSQQHSSRINDDEYDLVEKPSAAWYLVPFLFGLIEGIIGYVGTKDKDEGMAFGLLGFSIIWSFILLIIGWASFFLISIYIIVASLCLLHICLSSVRSGKTDP